MNKKLKALLESAKTDHSQHTLDLKGIFRLNPNFILEDLTLLDEALWVLPHIAVIDLFQRYELSLAWAEKPQTQTFYVFLRKENFQYRVIGTDENIKHVWMKWDDVPPRLRCLKDKEGQTVETLRSYLPHFLKMSADRKHTIFLDDVTTRAFHCLLNNHPHIRSLLIQDDTGIDPHLFDKYLSRNFSLMISPRQHANFEKSAEFCNSFFSFLLAWLKRKTVHAIIGNRPLELEALFSSEPYLVEHITQVLESHEKAMTELNEQHEAVTADYDKIRAMNDAKIVPPRIDGLRQEWLVNGEAKMYFDQWKCYFSHHTDLKQRYEAYSRILPSKDYLKQRLEQIAAYIMTHLGLAWSQCFNELQVWSDNSPYRYQFKDLDHIIWQGVNSGLPYVGKGEVGHSFALPLAFRHDSYEAFKKLLELGANPFVLKGFIEEVFDTRNRGQKYLLAVVDYLKEHLDHLEREKRRFEFSILPNKLQDYSEETIKALNHIYEVLSLYLVEKFPERLQPSLPKLFLSST